MPKPLALVIRAAGTNCDAEMVRAFEMAGAAVRLVHLDGLIAEPGAVGEAELIGFPGGFSYGDDVASGRIFAAKLKAKLWPALAEAAGRGVPMIAACNGFQILVQTGLLPGKAQGHISHGHIAQQGVGGSGAWGDEPPAQEIALAHNAGGRFIDRWCGVKVDPASVCIWTKGLEAFDADAMRLPIAHGEGRVVFRDDAVLARMKASGQIALRYAAGDNPNGSTDDIAGVCDPTGRIFGLMPHPERYLDWNRHPFWTAMDEKSRKGDTPGMMMFRNAVEAACGVGEMAKGQMANSK